MTLEHEDKIDAFEASFREKRPWLFANA